jgi:hypothetical protein
MQPIASPKNTSIADNKLFYLFTIIALIVSLIFIISFGFIGIGRADVFSKDFAYLYAAGQVWLAGGSPYIFELFHETANKTAALNPATNFAYVPTIALPSLLLSLLPLATAKIIMGIINIAALISLCWVSLNAAFRDQDISWLSPQTFLLSAIIIGNPLTSHVIWMGQTTLIVTAAICLAFIWSGQGKTILAGIMLSIASIKPQLSLLFFLWILFEQQYKVIGVGIIASVIVSIPAILSSGLSLPLEWLNALEGYKDSAHSIMTFRHVFGLRSLLSDFGIILPSLLPVALICVGLIFWKRSLFYRIDVLPLLLITTLALIYAHDYDVAAFFVISGSLWWFLSNKPIQGVIALAMLAYLCIPQRLALHFLPDIGHYREPIFFILSAWLLWMMIQQSSRRNISGSSSTEKKSDPSSIQNSITINI